MSNTYIGIDPGNVSGGIAVITSDNELWTYQIKNLTDREVSQTLSTWHNPKGVIEKVHSMPKQGVSSAFKFGMNFGMLKMALISAQVSFREVTPQSWMKYYGMKKSPAESKPQWKKRLREKAQQLYPDHKIVNNTADAILIAHYCKETT
jgi:Holliday junction resolvasome RuvABC endonuclease subunit